MMKMTTKAGVVLVAAAVVLAAWCPCVVGQVTQPAVLLRDFGNAMYIGHTRSLGSVAFNPSNPNELLSASEDGTLRLWDKGSGGNVSHTHTHAREGQRGKALRRRQRCGLLGRSGFDSKAGHGSPWFPGGDYCCDRCTASWHALHGASLRDSIELLGGGPLPHARAI
eukprot:TRINITY_DN10266_c0_g2_i1.p1 TRINITY_DN10266_c0_g2~~TRINITY_DN10266_c0_g2_i1.p1  ORF type:complete len:167 (-),score=16.02 TRINITY_DN10266_c0_g2_i1:426-926(-)